jgi:hypothetical protein
MRLRDQRGRYWLGPFIEWLLYLDSAGSDLTFVDPKRAALALTTMDDLLLDKSRFIKMVLKECPGFRFASAHPNDPGPKDAGGAMPEDEEEQFYQLIRLWRLEHPEPPKARQIPKGQTQHEMDPDSD